MILAAQCIVNIMVLWQLSISTLTFLIFYTRYSMLTPVNTRDCLPSVPFGNIEQMKKKKKYTLSTVNRLLYVM